MTHVKAAIASSVLVLLCAGCGAAVEALPAAQAQASAGSSDYTTEFARMHAAIPANAGSDIQDYQ